MPGYFNYGSPQGQIVNLQAPNLSGTNAFELPLRALNQGIRNYIDLGDLNRLNNIEARAKLADQSAGEAYRILSSYNNFDDLSALAKDPDSALSKAMKGMRAAEARELAKAITDREEFGRTKAFNEMGDTYAGIMSRINQLTTSGRRQEADALRNKLADFVAVQRGAGDYIKSLLGAQETVDNSRSVRAWQGANTAKIYQGINAERQALKDLGGAVKWRSNYSGLNYKNMVTAALQDYKRGLLTVGEFNQIVNGNVLKSTYAPEQVENNWLNEKTGINITDTYTNALTPPSIPGEVPSPTNKQITSTQTDQTPLTQTASSQKASNMLKDASGSNDSKTSTVQSTKTSEQITQDPGQLQELASYSIQPPKQVSQQKEPGTSTPSQTAQTFSREWIPVNPIDSNTKEDTVKNANEAIQRALKADASGEFPEQLISFGDVLSDVGNRVGRYWKNVGHAFIGKPSQPAKSTASDTQQINAQGFNQAQWNRMLQLAEESGIPPENFQAILPETWDTLRTGGDTTQVYNKEITAYRKQQEDKAKADNTIQYFNPNNVSKILKDTVDSDGINLDSMKTSGTREARVAKNKLFNLPKFGILLKEGVEKGIVSIDNYGTVQEVAQRISPEAQKFITWMWEYNDSHANKISPRMAVLALHSGVDSKNLIASLLGRNTYTNSNKQEYTFSLNQAKETAKYLAESISDRDILTLSDQYNAIEGLEKAYETDIDNLKNLIGSITSPQGFVSKGEMDARINLLGQKLAQLHKLSRSLGVISTNISNMNLK